MKPKAGPSSDAYSEEDWNTEVDENAQGADAYRYSKVGTVTLLDEPPWLILKFVIATEHVSHKAQCVHLD